MKIDAVGCRVARTFALSFGFAVLVASPAANATFVPVSTQSTVSVYAGSGGGPWPNAYEADTSLRLSDELVLTVEDAEVGHYGQTTDAQADAELNFEVFENGGSIIASGRASGYARHNDVRVENPGGTYSVYRLTSASSSASTFYFGFRVTTPYQYAFESATTGGGTTGNNVNVTFQSQYGLMGNTGVLQPNLYYFISATAYGNASVPTEGCYYSSGCLDSFSGYDRAWDLQLDVTPVPLPAAVWFLLSGVAGLRLVAQRRLPDST